MLFRSQQMKLILKDSIVEYNHLLERYKQTKQEKNELELEQQKIKDKTESIRTSLEHKNIEIHRQRSRKEQLVDLTENKSQYSFGVRSILKAKSSLQGIVGVLGELIETEEKYEQALSIALGQAATFIVARNDQNARDAI